VDISVDGRRSSDPADWSTGWEWRWCKPQVPLNHAPGKNVVSRHKLDMKGYVFHLWARS